MLGVKEFRIVVQDRLSLVYFPHLHPLPFYNNKDGFYMLGRKEYRIIVQDRLYVVYFPHLYLLLLLLTRLVGSHILGSKE
jgi:hypothetical protein